MAASAYTAITQMDMFSGSKRTIPKGTTDVVMERLFPTKRSSIPIDDERRQAVFEILVVCGVLSETGERTM